MLPYFNDGIQGQLKVTQNACPFQGDLPLLNPFERFPTQAKSEM